MGKYLYMKISHDVDDFAVKAGMDSALSLPFHRGPELGLVGKLNQGVVAREFRSWHLAVVAE